VGWAVSSGPLGDVVHSAVQAASWARIDGEMRVYPKVRSVVPLSGKRLLVTFENDVQKLYDCSPLLQTDMSRPLRDDWLFRVVRADAGGYGVSWTDGLDLSESELWEHGDPVMSKDLVSS
jgi:hypothetical protein